MEQQVKIMVQHHKRADVPGSVYRMVPDGAPREHTVMVAIDTQGIAAELGEKAVLNKNGKSSALHGLVKVKHIKG